jgi:hypothetical protein
MLGRTLGVVAAFALLGGLLVVAQGQADRDRQGSARSGGQTSWLKYLVFLLVVLGMLAAARLGGAAFVVTILALLAVVLVECFRPLGARIRRPGSVRSRGRCCPHGGRRGFRFP